MTALLLSLVLTCGPAADGKASTCTCNHGAQAEATESPTGAEAAKAAPAECHHGAATQAEAAKPTGAVIARGEKLKGLPSVELTRLLSAPSEYDGKTVGLEGTVRRACERKGCWMELSASDKGPGVRVTFKNYGFFVPLDSAGSTAKVEGTVKVAELSPERAKHFESEGAQVAKDKDGKYREVQLIATAVELHR